jgi:homoserine kinase type II
MAVFTPVSPEDARQFLEGYDAGELSEITPIAEGVENTNYRLDTTAGAFVLTLFEKRVRAEELPFYLGLMEHLAGEGFPTPPPLRSKRGGLSGELNGRPAALVAWRPGAWPRRPTPNDAAQAGALLARMHLDGSGFHLERPNAMGPAAWPSLARKSAERAKGEDARLLHILQTEIEALARDWPAGLPTGPIHADYFPDNVLYDRGEISAVIDFYFACTDALAYDVAIALGAWGFDGEGAPREDVMSAFLNAYESVRPLNPAETEALPALCRGAAVRFSLTRLHDRLFHDTTWLVAPKDPAPYVRRLQYYQGRRSLVA